jgi:hypothetical protein
VSSSHKHFFTFACSIPFVVLPAAFAVIIMFIYSCRYEETAYALVVYLCTSQWCDNDNHDMPEHATRTVKLRDYIDGNNGRSIIICFIPVTDNEFIYTCYCM